MNTRAINVRIAKVAIKRERGVVRVGMDRKWDRISGGSLV